MDTQLGYSVKNGETKTKTWYKLGLGGFTYELHTFYS
jgi:hypothetical protein